MPEAPSQPSPRRRAQRRKVKLLFLALFLPVLLELGAWTAGKLLQSRWAMYRDPVLPGQTSIDYDEYLRLRDPELGWPGPSSLGGELYERDGSCVSPANRDLAGEEWAVSLYGDSFTWGRNNHISAEDAWSNRLARALGKRVLNFAVPAYGTDQAYLRYLRNAQDTRAKVVVLGHMTEDMVRNLTRLRDLTGGGARELAWKPRFVLDARGELELVPLPRLSEAEYRRFLGLESPQLVLEHESFAPGGPMGAVRLTFPFTLALLRNTGYWRFRARLGRYPDSVPLYRPGHPLRGLELTHAILRAFGREAARRGQRPLVILFPGPNDAQHFQATGEDVQEELARRVEADGVAVLRFTPLLIRWLAGRPSASAFREGHFVPELDPFLVETVLRKLGELGVTAPAGR